MLKRIVLIKNNYVSDLEQIIGDNIDNYLKLYKIIENVSEMLHMFQF